MAIYECQHCGIEVEGYGYDDDNFHRNVIPNMKCLDCGKIAGEDIRMVNGLDLPNTGLLLEAWRTITLRKHGQGLKMLTDEQITFNNLNAQIWTHKNRIEDLMDIICDLEARIAELEEELKAPFIEQIRAKDKWINELLELVRGFWKYHDNTYDGGNIDLEYSELIDRAAKAIRHLP